MNSSVEELLNDFVNRMIDAAGKNLESVILFGSAARTEKTGGIHDLNLLCTLKSSDASQLRRIASVTNWWTLERRQPVPMFFLPEELAASADVFAIEFRDMQKSHRILFGSDPVKTLKVPMNLHRVQVEHGLRTTILKLRQLYACECGNPKELVGAVVKSFSSAKTLLRHALVSVGQDSPDAEAELFTRAAGTFGVKREAFDGIAALRLANGACKEIDDQFDEYLRALEGVATALERKLPKREWGRSKCD